MTPRKKDVELAPTLGWGVIDWIEDLLCHGPGDVQGKPVVLDDEERVLVLRAYELEQDADGRWRRRFHRVVYSRAKGRAKSEKAGLIGCAEALGPVRFDGFDAHGEPVGAPVTAPEVLVVATEEGQADNTYDVIYYVLQNGRVAEDYPGLDVGLTRTFIPGGGSIEPVTSAASSKDGARSTFVVFDETHLMYTPELKRMHATIRRNLGKRKIADPWSLETTTMYRPGQGSVAEGSHEYALAVQAGRIKDPRLLFDHREASVGLEDIGDDDTALLAALTEVYGEAAAWMDLRRLVNEIRDPQTEAADAERYFLNRARVSSDQWMDKAAWNACAKPDVTVAGKRRITLGFDGAKFEDAAALVGCDLETGHLFTVAVWEKPDDLAYDAPRWEIRSEDVDAAVSGAFGTWKVVRFHADPPWWQDVIAQWQSRWGGVVVPWWTESDKQMAAALELLHTDVVTGAVSHDGDERLTRHVLNARKLVKTAAADPDGRRERVLIRKENPRSKRKIDAAVAATLAYDARADAIAAGALKSRSRRLHTF